jgi:hypothetical protein
VSPQVVDATTPKMADWAGVMPKPAIDLISQFIDGVQLISTIERSNNCDHLIMAQPMLQFKLVNTDAGVGLPCLDNTVKYKMNIIPLLKREIILSKNITQILTLRFVLKFFLCI